ncbi:MAG: right-handed parallel beta-helix repeat-containing protein [Ardenticatenales bacterium]|nr:right-handed parallel beta-helix repeat-containing protein [Ardenticatenales bacterium]
MRSRANPVLRTLALTAVAVSLVALHARATTAETTTVTLPPTRRIDWSLAGIPGGIPVRTTVCTTLDAARFGDGRTDATAAIQGALDACPAGQVVILPAGTYATSATINLRTDKTLRGAGQGRTMIRYQGSGTRSVLDMRGSIYNDVFNRKRTYDVVVGAAKDATTITLSATTDITVGDVLLVDQRNDGVLVDHVGSEGPCTYCSRENGMRARGQLVEIVGIGPADGLAMNTVALSLPLFFDLDPALAPQAVLVSARSMVRRAGVESLTLTQQQPVNDFIVEMDGAQQCWIKDVEITGMKRRGLWHIESLQNELRDNTIHGAAAGYGRDRGYGLQLDLQSTANLVENNVVHDVDGGGIMTSGGAVGNVIGYNHLPDIRFDDPWWLIGGPSLNHSAHPSMNLWEGNIGPQISGDFIHGSASHQTFFRCRSTGWKEEVATSNNNAVDLQHKNTYMTVMGCILGTPGKSDTYEVAYPASGPSALKPIWRLGYGAPGGGGDPNVRATLLRHGNWDSVTDGTVWDPGIADRALPASLYLSAKPAWWGDALPWPAIGPDLAPMVGKIPAQVRYEEGMNPVTPQATATAPATRTATAAATSTDRPTAAASVDPTDVPTNLAAEHDVVRLPVAWVGR